MNSQPIPYTKLHRRIKALLIDGIVLAISLFATIFSVTAIGLPSPLIESIVILAVTISIEPLFISFTGASIGHRIAGLRVRHSTEDKNLNLLLSYLRFIIKLPLGTLSLVSVLTTRKHQALHDLISRSIVVHQAPEQLASHHIVDERIDNTRDFIFPSKTKRCILITVYLFCALFALTTISSLLLNDACLNYAHCSSFDNLVQMLLPIAFWACLFSIVGFGWQGYLYGARKKPRTPSPNTSSNTR